MSRFVRRVFDVHEGEGRRTGLMFVYIFLVIAALLVIKPAATSLFLSEFGVAQLPLAYVVVAAAAGLTSFAYTRMLLRVPVERVAVASMQIGAAVSLAFWSAHFFAALSGGIVYALYVWVAVWAVTSASQFWVLANLVFNAREAKRLFGLLGAGAIGGGVFGGYATNLLAPVIGTENLFLVSGGLLACCVPLVTHVAREVTNPPPDGAHGPNLAVTAPRQGSLRLLARSRYLLLVASLVGMGVVVAKLIDYQFSALANAAIPDDDQLTAFFGFWLSTFNLVSLLVQLSVTRRLIALVGVGSALFLLPSAILVASGVLFFVPTVGSAVLLRMADGSLKQSVHKAAMELLYLPIPASMKGQAKTFIDVFVDSAATGIGGLLLVIATFAGGMAPRQVGIVTAALVIVWMVLIAKARREYVRAFRARIERSGTATHTSTLSASTSRAMASVREGLRSADDDVVEAALQALPDSRAAELADVLVDLLAHRRATVRAGALHALCSCPDTDVSPQARRLARDRHLPVRVEALTYLFERSPDGIDTLTAALADDRLAVKTAALVCAARESRSNRTLRRTLAIEERIDGLFASVSTLDDPGRQRACKTACALAIGEGNLTGLLAHLDVLLDDSEPQVAHAALQALGTMGSQQAVERLLVVLEEGDQTLHYEAIRSLNRLRRDYPGLRFDEQELESRILAESDDYLRTLTMLSAGSSTFSRPDQGGGAAEADDARAALTSLLEERLDENLERIFRLLGLRYPHDAIYDAFLGIQREQPQDLRASALEFLDNVLDPGLKRIIVPLVETTLADALVDDVLERLEIGVPSEPECIRSLLSGRDVEMTLATLRTIAAQADQEYIADVRALAVHGDARVRRAAQQVLARAGSSDESKPGGKVSSGPEA